MHFPIHLGCKPNMLFPLHPYQAQFTLAHCTDGSGQVFDKPSPIDGYLSGLPGYIN